MVLKRHDSRKGRTYTVDENGERLPSVTTILNVVAKPALINWAAKEERIMVGEAAGQLYQELAETLRDPLNPEEFTRRLDERLGDVKAHRKKLKEAADIGTSVHKRIEWEFRKELGLPIGPEPLLTHPKAIRAFDHWKDWRISVKLRVIAIEEGVYSLEYKFAGTLDLLAEVDDPDYGLGVEILDFKTGKYIYVESFLQNAAYRIAARERGIHTDRGRIIRLPKEEDDPDFETKVVPSLDVVEKPFISLIPVFRFLKEQEEQRKAA